MTGELERVTRERDLYWQLLELGQKDAPEEFLDLALSLFIDVARARRGYIELRDSRAPDASTFSLLRGLDDTSLSADGLSRSVIAEAYATSETVMAISASCDPRFQDRGSVREQSLEAVLCAPIGSAPVLGVIYLQNRVDPGPFSSDDRRRAEVFAKHVATFAERLLARRRERKELDPTQPFRAKLKLDGVIGSSPAIAVVFQQVALIAPLQISVLITGDSGTGKTQLARAIHDNSPQAGAAFVELNCATLPEDLVETELFGAAPGGHSTATRRIEGKISAAENGTLFLDEVTELSARAQAKVLQLVQSGIYYPVGDSKARHANLRIIAATNANMASALSERRFREDLYYRLNVFPIRVPLLAERREDIADLATRFCRLACETNRLPALTLSPGALMALEYAEWQGNVRELANVVNRGVIHAHGEGSLSIERGHLFSEAAAQGSSPPSITFHHGTRRYQRDLLLETLEREEWNVAAAARVLDLTRPHVYNLMATLSIKRPDSRSEPTSTPERLVRPGNPPRLGLGAERKPHGGASDKL